MNRAFHPVGCLVWVAFVAGSTGAIAGNPTAPHQTPPAVASSPAPSEKGATQLDINRASVEELCSLPGIGRKKAETIVEYRRKRPFTRLTQLLRVKGIGKKTLKRLKPLLRVDRPISAAHKVSPRPSPL